MRQEVIEPAAHESERTFASRSLPFQPAARASDAAAGAAPYVDLVL